MAHHKHTRKEPQRRTLHLGRCRFCGVKVRYQLTRRDVRNPRLRLVSFRCDCGLPHTAGYAYFAGERVAIIRRRPDTGEFVRTPWLSAYKQDTPYALGTGS